jgi:1-acyl-sn-glycerol-3-phosphate acyltransferase
LVLIALYPRHKTIVKGRLFDIPVFGRMLTGSGYIPSTGGGGRREQLLNQMEALDCFFSAGGNLFIFPEGTRSRSGNLESFNPGAFKIARNYNVPVQVLTIHNTDRMFTPGSFAFQSRERATIALELAGTLPPPEEGPRMSIARMSQAARAIMVQSLSRPGPHTRQ